MQRLTCCLVNKINHGITRQCPNDLQTIKEHLPSIEEPGVARYQDHQDWLRTRNHQGTYFLSTGQEQQEIRTIRIGSGQETIKALTRCQQARSSKGSGPSGLVQDKKPSRHLPAVNRPGAARGQDHQDWFRTRNHQGTYLLSTGQEQQGIRTIRIGSGQETIKALTSCQQARSSKGSGPSGLVQDKKPSRHLHAVNRPGAARDQDHQDWFRTRNHQGTYMLSTGQEQQGIRTIRIGSGQETIKALTHCQQARSSKGSGPSGLVQDKKPSRHLLAVNRPGAARDQDHQDWFRTRNHQGTHPLSTGQEQQGIRTIRIDSGPETIKALTRCQQARSSK
ncbi:uncharacterized protein EDB91DRAFT_1115400 [Suillus paluster]|uniref:uncharacterized protein n=1 Tax=Suillus paluster TaxID=48578 RepID=UPI001B87B5F8|nr:uncharacterized protein EDB91DRAFT_1115400 [Suillus paluster]KAG1747901.1 hypothetical protein EDB91DRAFT_1115400 [Suillus paluster]